jgi:hypothetical protein
MKIKFLKIRSLILICVMIFLFCGCSTTRPYIEIKDSYGNLIKAPTEEEWNNEFGR